MNGEQVIQLKRKEIQIHALDALKWYLGQDLRELDALTPKQIETVFSRAKLGMQFEKEMNLTKRANEMNFIRVGKLITENKKELRQYIKKSLPQYSII